MRQIPKKITPILLENNSFLRNLLTLGIRDIQTVSNQAKEWSIPNNQQWQPVKIGNEKSLQRKENTSLLWSYSSIPPLPIPLQTAHPYLTLSCSFLWYCPSDDFLEKKEWRGWSAWEWYHMTPCYVSFYEQRCHERTSETTNKYVYYYYIKHECTAAFFLPSYLSLIMKMNCSSNNEDE